MIARGMAAVALAGALAGCGATTTTTTARSPAPAVATPAGAQSLRQLAFVHGPTNFFLPGGLVPRMRVDAPNVVTITAQPAEARGVDAWLAGRLPGWGWQVDARADRSLVFHDAHWQGAWTCSSELCALTLREQPS